MKFEASPKVAFSLVHLTLAFFSSKQNDRQQTTSQNFSRDSLFVTPLFLLWCFYFEEPPLTNCIALKNRRKRYVFDATQTSQKQSFIMAYPPPPGLSSYSKPSSKPASLPARPPASKVPAAPYKPAYNAPAAQYGAPAYPSSAFVPRQLGGAPAAPAYNAYVAPTYYGQPAQDAYAAPQIQNPFPMPGHVPVNSNAIVDPEMEAQIAHWQTAYSKESSASQYAGRPTYATNPNAPTPSADAAPLGGKDAGNTVVAAPHADAGSKTGRRDDAKPTVVRTGGGTQWTDSSLLEWDPSHFRIFVGNLAGEVTDESLLKAFSRWPSVQKARVVRDKRTTKSKGFGFVSFSNGDDFFQAAREMQGKYIGSHPVLIKRSTTEIKAVVPKDERKGKGKWNNKKNNHDKGKAGGSGVKDGGVQKAGQKTKGGLKILG